MSPVDPEEIATMESMRKLAVTTLVAVQCILCGLTGCRQEAASDRPGTAGPLYDIKGDRVVFPGFDDRGATTPKELLRLTAADFEKPVHVFRDRAYISSPGIATIPFEMPSRSAAIRVLLRGRPTERVFPQIEIAILAVGEDQPEPIFQGSIQWAALQAIKAPVPKEFLGKKVQLRFKLLNELPMVDDGLEALIANIAVLEAPESQRK